MPSNSTQLWTYAQSLNTPCEESRRAKISRAYYALYHHAIDFHNSLPSSGHSLAVGGGVHRKLIQQLTNPTVADDAMKGRSRKIGTMLGLARDLRDEADYENTSTIEPKHVRECLRYVEQGLAS
ncbi:hypothetical protein ABE485_06375 [Achromobacter spanius]|uniref:hypothetical protein n=1 Tax=Achromobacter spanius TaxID=217203 RepID=UPI00320B6461